jgi:hypothetical protein
MMLLGLVAVSACTDDPSPATAAEFRCRTLLPGGGCYSQPADCPVTIHLSDTPHCPLDTEMIPASEDTCAQKYICVD